MVVSMASWAPPKSGNPSATTSYLRVSAALGSADPSPSASCTVVATSVEWKATPAGTHGQGKREMKAAQ